MYRYEIELAIECRKQKARWNGKVITTDKQWNNNAYGALTPTEYNLDDLFSNAWAQIRQDTDYYGENYCSLYDC